MEWRHCSPIVSASRMWSGEVADAEFSDSVMAMYTFYLKAHKCLSICFHQNRGGKGVTHFLKTLGYGSGNWLYGLHASSVVGHVWCTLSYEENCEEILVVSHNLLQSQHVGWNTNAFCWKNLNNNILYVHTHTHTHTHIYIYIYIYIHTHTERRRGYY